MEQELLAWAQVAVRELMCRGHASLQILLMMTLFQSQPSTRKVLKNYLPYLEKPPDHLGVCRLYARAGLVDELRQAMQERPLSESDMYHLVRAGARGGHWSIIEPYQDSMRTRYDCLFVAVKRGHMEIIQRVTAYESVGHSSLALLAQQAIHCGRVDIFKAVLSALATARTGHNNFLWELAEIQSVLTAAVESYDPEMVRAALQGMQIPFAVLDFEAQAACQKPASTVALVCPFLETRPQLLNALLVAACEKGNMEIAQYMLERGASALDDALEACYEHRNIEMVQFLLDRGARDPTGYLVAYGGPQIAALLLRVGACQPQQALSQDALYFAPDILELVLAAGPVDLESALRKALALLPCQPQALGSVMVLIEAGARLPEADSLYGQTLEACLRLAKSNSSDLPSRTAAVEYMAALAGVSAEDVSVGLAELLAKDALVKLPQVPVETQVEPEVPVQTQSDFEDYDFDY